MENKSMLDYTLIAFLLLSVLLFLHYRWPKYYNVSAGVKENLGRIKTRLDDLGIEYTFEMLVDGACMHDFNEEVAPGLLSLKKRHVEVAVGIIRVLNCVNGKKLGKEVTVSGYTAPRARLALGITPKHCWDYDPRALTAFNHDPKLGQVEYSLNIRPNNIPSQMFPREIIEAAVGYLSRIESEETYDNLKDSY